MKKLPSSSVTGPPPSKSSSNENKTWFLLVPYLVFHQICFFIQCGFYQIIPSKILTASKPAKKIKPAHSAIKNSDGSKLSVINLLIPTFGIFVLGFFSFQLYQLLNSPAKISFSTSITESSIDNILSEENLALPSPLSLSSTTQQIVNLTELEQTLHHHLELLNQQPLHQNLLINTALIYYQLQDEENYLRYLDLAKNINPNLDVFPTSVENPT